jgi:hypothetical protein
MAKDHRDGHPAGGGPVSPQCAGPALRLELRDCRIEAGRDGNGSSRRRGAPENRTGEVIFLKVCLSGRGETPRPQVGASRQGSGQFVIAPFIPACKEGFAGFDGVG